MNWMNEKPNTQKFYVGNGVLNSEQLFFSPSCIKSRAFSSEQKNASDFKILINLQNLFVILKAICPMLWQRHATTRLQYQPVVVKSGFYL
jgi:hypothetical protein